MGTASIYKTFIEIEETFIPWKFRENGNPHEKEKEIKKKKIRKIRHYTLRKNTPKLTMDY